MMLPLALLLLAVQAPPTADPAAAERVRLMVAVNCRINAERLTVEPPDSAGTVILRLGGDGPLSDAQLHCYGNALTAGGPYPSIDNHEIERRYIRLVDRDTLQRARQSLRDMHLLGRLPRRLWNEPLGAFAGRLERLCGARPGSVLGIENGRITLAEVGEEAPSSEENQAWLCAVHAAMVRGYNPIVPRPVEPPPIPLP